VTEYVNPLRFGATRQGEEVVTADHYTYRVHFSAADGEYVATVAEFASLLVVFPSVSRSASSLVIATRTCRT
jgi:hypothetical protein